MEVPQKIKNRTALWPSNSTSEHLSKENGITVLGRYLYSDVHCSTIHNNEGIKQPKCPLMSNGKQTAYAHVHAKSLQSCPTLCDPTDCSPPGSSVHGTLQARILEWVAIPFCRRSSQTRDRTRVSFIGRWVLYHWVTRESCCTLLSSNTAHFSSRPGGLSSQPLYRLTLVQCSVLG